MPDTPPKQFLLPNLIGFAVAAAGAAWSASQFALTGSSLGYGVLTGLCFGAMFAFGQRVKQRLFPSPPAPGWKAPNTPNAALRPAQRALANNRPLSVQFDAQQIQTRRGDAIRDTVAWADIERIAITSGDLKLPMPCWKVLTAHGGMRIPNDTPGLEALMEQFAAQLPGYDNDATYAAIIEAMGAMQGDFDIWHKAAGTAAATPPTPPGA